MELKLLMKMVSVQTDKLGDSRYTALWYSFYDFQELSGLNKSDYEALLKEMRHEKLIEIDLNGSDNFNCARIRATNKGVAYLIEHVQ